MTELLLCYIIRRNSACQTDTWGNQVDYLDTNKDMIMTSLSLKAYIPSCQEANVNSVNKTKQSLHIIYVCNLAAGQISAASFYSIYIKHLYR